MGFYAPHTLVEDAQRHGVEVRPVDVNALGLGLHAGAGQRIGTGRSRCGWGCGW